MLPLLRKILIHYHLIEHLSLFRMMEILYMEIVLGTNLRRFPQKNILLWHERWSLS